MSRQGHLDRLAQLHDDDLAEVIKVIELALLRGSGRLSRLGGKLVADASRPRIVTHPLATRIYNAGGEVLFTQEYEEEDDRT